MIMVVDDTADAHIESIKNKFFTNVLSAGLDFELEMSVVSCLSYLFMLRISATILHA